MEIKDGKTAIMWDLLAQETKKTFLLFCPLKWDACFGGSWRFINLINSFFYFSSQNFHIFFFYQTICNRRWCHDETTKSKLSGANFCLLWCYVFFYYCVLFEWKYTDGHVLHLVMITTLLLFFSNDLWRRSLALFMFRGDQMHVKSHSH